MRWLCVFNIIGYLIFFFSLAFIIPMLFAFYFSDGSFFAFTASFSISIFVSLLLIAIFRKSKAQYLSSKEGITIVSIGWTIIGLLGALPLYIYSELTFIDCLFESISGFTTTGASILSNIESMPESILLWRSLIQWLGGMGIIVLSIAILPFIESGGMQLYKAEIPSPTPDKLKPRIKDTALILWKVYIGFSLIQVMLLTFGGMSFFDATCHTFTSMPTGGFSVKNLSIAHYDNLYFDIIIMLFMLFAGINFSLHYQLIRGKALTFWNDTECRFFLILILVFILIITFNIYGQVYDTFGKALRYGSFQVISIITTTGFATADYELWPSLSQFILFACMFIGATAGSTGGGMKCIRVILCFKYCIKEIGNFVHPKSVSNIKIKNESIPDNVLKGVMGFLSIYIGLFVICSAILCMLGPDILTSMSAVASAIGNIGPGFGTIGPTENYLHLPQAAKLLLTWCMLLGRLEIYTFLIFLVPEFWKK